MCQFETAVKDVNNTSPHDSLALPSSEEGLMQSVDPAKEDRAEGPAHILGQAIRWQIQQGACPRLNFITLYHYICVFNFLFFI